MTKTKKLFLIVPILLTGCATVSYIPRIVLDVSPATIEKSLRIEKLKDSSPPEDRENPFGGFSVTNKKALSNDLEVEITNSLVYDFQINGVFEKVTKYDQSADYVLSGEIKKFLGKSKLTTYGIVSLASIVGIYTWYFGIPIRKNETDIQLILTLKDKQGKLVGTYKGMFIEGNKSNLYHDKSSSLYSLTNNALSAAIAQIRSQLLDDFKKK